MSSTSLFRPALLANVENPRRSLTAEIPIVVAASLFVAICAHISVPMPFTPVPTTMQPFAVILVGMLLGPVSGFAAMTLYLVEGATGLPVFTPQGPGGIAQLLGPTAGYLFSYPLAAAVAGAIVRLSRRLMPAFPAALLAGSLALLPVFSMGAFWLGHVLRLPPAAAIHLAITPFLLAEALKLCAAAAAYTAFHTARRA
jgi:biotin transport system substrate-specific component